MRDLLTRVPKSAQALAATLVRSIFAQPTAEGVWAQHGRVVEQLEGRSREAATLLVEAAEDILAFAAFPGEHWRQIWSNNPLERWHRERSAGAPAWSASSRTAQRPAVPRLVGAVRAEQHDAWAVSRRYLAMERAWPKP